MDLLADIWQQTWALVLQSAAYLLVGFVIAGLIHAFLPLDRVMRWLGSRRFGAVLRAAAIGAPLPLCSCSVVPVAAALRKRGAGKGATTAFLISTPETGVDSIAVTYALMDPVMTVARPLAAVSTALAAGVAQNLWGDSKGELAAESSSEHSPHDDGSPAAPSCCGGTVVEIKNSCGCASEAGGNGGTGAAEPPVGSQRTFVGRLRDALRFGMIEMFEDLGIYMLAGFLAAGVIAVALANFELRVALGSAWAPLIMLVAGIPMYVCASAATPMIAVLISEGLSPGAGLVFLLAGPATNAASVVLLHRILGRRGVLVYLVSIAACSLLAGYATNGVYALGAFVPRALTRADICCTAPSWVDLVSAIGLTALIALGLWRKYGAKLFANGAQRAAQRSAST